MWKTCLFLMLCGVFSLLSMDVYAQYKVDSVSITSLVRDDYATLANFDTMRHRRNCTYDYKLVEDGEVWNMDRELAHISSLANSKQTRTNDFVFKSVTIYSTTSYAIYHLRSVITQPDGKIKKYHWIETAILRKVANQWKIALIHSTQLKE